MSPEIVPNSDDLYFIKAPSGPIKIGRARDPRKRLAQCQTGSHEALELLGVAKGRGYQERIWHAVFRQHRLSGEWFRPNDDLADAIAFAIAGKDWWDHLYPPPDFEWLGEDEDELQEGIEDWHIAIMVAIAGLRDGEKPPLHDPNLLFEYADQKLLAYIESQAKAGVSFAEFRPL